MGIQVTTNLDIDPWTDLADPPPKRGVVERIGILPAGTTTGRATVAIVIHLDDGTHVIAETTWRLFAIAAKALAAAPVIQMEGL